MKLKKIIFMVVLLSIIATTIVPSAVFADDIKDSTATCINEKLAKKVAVQHLINLTTVKSTPADYTDITRLSP